MQQHIICHCGKCNVKCNKHNKKAKCDNCKKVRMLGTVISSGRMQHFCDKCCEDFEKNLKKEEQDKINDALNDMRDKHGFMKKICERIDYIEFSVRTSNILKNVDIEFIGELIIVPESDMVRWRNFGKKSLGEIKRLLKDRGLYLGMDKTLEEYGINRFNVREKLIEYRKCFIDKQEDSQKSGRCQREISQGDGIPEARARNLK